MAFHRGTVTKITVEIEYPDGSTKTSELADPASISHIAFDDQHVSPDDSGDFNVSEDDWMQNPAMMIYSDKEISGIPFCTHNGCKT